MNSDDDSEDRLAEAISAEFDYLARLRSSSRHADLAARVRALRDYGWEVLTIAEGMATARQWLYQLMSTYPDAPQPPDAPALVDLRVPESAKLSMRQDLAKIPAPLCTSLTSMWKQVAKDRSAGLSRVAVDIDVTIALLLRRGVTYVKIAQCGHVTHRAVIERVRRAVTRSTLPDMDTYLHYTSPPTPRTATEASSFRRKFALVQVVATTFTRFYTLRRPDGRLFMLDNPSSPPQILIDAGLDEYTVVTNEKDLARIVAEAEEDVSELYAVPVQWLYTESVPEAAWHPLVFDPVADVYPTGLEPSPPLLQEKTHA